jgi:hypothetical protein
MSLIRFAAGYAAALLPLSVIAQSPAIHPTTLNSASGRYVFGQINHLARDQYMLDTQTGRLWQMTCIKSDETDKSKCHLLALQAISYDTGAALTDLPPAPLSVPYGPRKRLEDAEGKK